MSCFIPFSDLGVRDFLIESRPKLQAVFGDCGFKFVDACIANLNEDTVKHIGQMEEIARRLLGHDHPRAIASTSDSEGIMLQYITH